VEKQDFEELVKNLEVDKINAIIRDGKASDFGKWVDYRLDQLREAIVSALGAVRDKDSDAWRLIGQLQLLNVLRAWLFEEVMTDGRERAED